MDNPEFVDMMLQRWFIQKGAAKGAPGRVLVWRVLAAALPGFCVNNVAERCQLAEEFWKLQRRQLRKMLPSQIIQGHAGGIGVASVSVDTLNHIG